MGSASDPGKERRRVEVWRDGAWRASSLPDLQIGEVFRMFESNGDLVEPAAPSACAVEMARESLPDMPGRYSIACEPCPDPSVAV